LRSYIVEGIELIEGLASYDLSFGVKEFKKWVDVLLLLAII
jgi:hypothetical protein